ncbi:transcriptional regulatory [Fusarium subglutinans]|uniref:Transcriptional regulatory n=1 Tax=Gibberella subglutinans TaxID=42677 RepID=A0A8H5UQY7_GIBSU|nr:transcriptional regulatory [Fusarium subglutinans]KAF5594035.1 transcriptional regulatory [Fusarium subglutinans]
MTSIDENAATGKPNSGRTACTECARRKQKASTKQSRFHRLAAWLISTPVRPSLERQSPRQEKRPIDVGIHGESMEDESGDEVDEAQMLQVMGYGSESFFNKIYIHTQHVLDVLPTRSFMDTLVKSFFDNVNFHYYIIYPSSFLDEYQGWWNDRISGNPIKLQWTCLLTIVCACSAQYLSTELQGKLEQELGVRIQTLTERYHHASSELYSIIPPRESHLHGVQYLLHSCYWYKSEARFTECWYSLSAAIRVAQEIGIHQEASMLDISNFEREMYRRVWFVLDTWDWQMSALLSRPLMIDRTYCKVGLPELNLEGTTPSPMLHLKLQSELIRRLFNRFGPTRNVVEPVDIQEYQKMLEVWMTKFPPIFDLDNPDYDQDALCPWISLHRHYIQTMGYSMILDPFRLHLAKSIDTKTATKAEVQIRSDGIDYALKLMTTLRGFFNHVWPRDAKFHFVIFSIFDTSALFSSILVHDKDGSAPKRQEMLDSFDMALDMIKHLRAVAPNFQLYYKILRRLRLKAAGKFSTIPGVPEPPRKCLKTAASKSTSLLPDIHVTPSTLSAVGCHAECDTASIARLSNAGLDHNLRVQPNHGFQRRHPSHDTDLVQETSTVVQPPIAQSSMNKDFQSLSRLESGSSEQTMFASISEEELGNLAELWRWKDLDLGIIDRLNP